MKCFVFAVVVFFTVNSFAIDHGRYACLDSQVFSGELASVESDVFYLTVLEDRLVDEFTDYGFFDELTTIVQEFQMTSVDSPLLIKPLSETDIRDLLLELRYRLYRVSENEIKQYSEFSYADIPYVETSESTLVKIDETSFEITVVWNNDDEITTGKGICKKIEDLLM